MTRTRSGKIADTRPQASRRDLTTKPAKAARRSIDRPSLATEHADRSGSASTTAIADGASTCTENTAEDRPANNPVPSDPADPAASDPAPPNDSATSAAVTCEAGSVAEQIAPPMPSTQPVDTAASDFAPITSGIATAASTESTAEDHAAKIPVPSASEDPASPKSTTNAVSTCDTTNGTADQDALPAMSTQPVNTMPDNPAPLPSTSTTAIPNAPTAIENSTPAPSTSTAATTDVVPSSGVSNGIVEQMATIANDLSQTNPRSTAGPQGSASRPSDKAQTLVRTAGNSPPVAELQAGMTKRKSERRTRRRYIRPLITTPNSPDDPFIVDDNSDDSESDRSLDDGPESYPKLLFRRTYLPLLRPQTIVPPKSA